MSMDVQIVNLAVYIAGERMGINHEILSAPVDTVSSMNLMVMNGSPRVHHLLANRLTRLTDRSLILVGHAGSPFSWLAFIGSLHT